MQPSFFSPPRHPHAPAGFTLIQVLIAMLLLGTGALAMISLQWHTLRAARDSQHHTRATLMAAELAELRLHLRDHPGRGAHWQFDHDTSNPADDVTPAPLACVQTSCAPTAFTRAVLDDWRARLAQAIPGVRAVLCRAAAAAPDDWSCQGHPGSALVLRIGWATAGSDTGAAMRPAATFVLGE